MADTSNREFKLVLRELISPTGLWPEVIREAVIPLQAGLLAVIGELLGPKATTRHCMLCLHSIMGQCLGLMAMTYKRGPTVTSSQFPGVTPLTINIDSRTEYITRFSLAGIRVMRLYQEKMDDVPKLKGEAR